MQPKTTPKNERTSLTRLPRGKTYDPFFHAEALGIQVIHRPIRTANELWMPDFNTIVLRTGLRAVHLRTALAHGIGHAELGHRDDSPKSEHQADRYASLHLVSPDELAEVTRWTNDPAKVAAELGLTLRLLGAYREWAG